MVNKAGKIEVYLERGQKRIFAGALDWPGWCRSGRGSTSGRDDESALRGLLDSAPRYAKVMQKAGIDFTLPAGPESLVVVERLEGGATTDFGAPEAAPSADEERMDEDELARQRAILSACWAAFDRGVRAAAGKTLSKGPRGGGRELEKIVQHVQGAEASYLNAMGVKFKPDKDASLEEQMMQTRQAILAGLGTANAPDAPRTGPRGGKLWSPRYFVRRTAWHVLDHLWEIEDRVEEQ